MSEETELELHLKAFIQRLLPDVKELEFPREMQVGSFQGGTGTAVLNGKTVTLLCGKELTINPNETVIGIPMGKNTYYVVGKK